MKRLAPESERRRPDPARTQRAYTIPSNLFELCRIRPISLRRYHDQTVRSRFRAPGLAGAAQHLPHLGVRLVARKTLKFFGRGVEPQNRVARPFGEPHLVVIVDVDRVDLRLVGRLPGLPLPAGRVVHADLPGHPLADPQSSLAV